MAQAPRLQLFGERLSQAMAAKGLNQSQLADSLDMHRANVTRWLRGDVPPLPTLVRIADTLKRDWQWLIGADEPADQAESDTVRKELVQRLGQLIVENERLRAYERRLRKAALHGDEPLASKRKRRRSARDR